MTGAQAAEPAAMVVGATNPKLPLHFYLASQDQVPKGTLTADEVHFPLRVIDTQNELLKVKVGTRELWLDPGEVTLNKASDYQCKNDVAVATGAGRAIAAQQGAGKPCR